MPHEGEEESVVPLVARLIGGEDSMSSMARAHVEIAHLIRDYGGCSPASTTSPEADDLVELRRLLYGLHAILQLHFAQEEEGAFSLVPNRTAMGQATAGAGAAPKASPRRGFGGT